MSDLIACADTDHFVHEPRVLWTVQRVRAAASGLTSQTARVTVPREHFYNGSSYPLTLNKLLISGIGYAFRSFQPDPLTVATQNEVHAAASAIGYANIFLSWPYSRNYQSRQFRIAAEPALPVSEAGMMYSTTPYSSGLLGLCRWDFDRAYRLPRASTIAIDVSGWNTQDIGTADLTDVDAYSTVLINETSTGRFGGNSRLRPRLPVPKLRSEAAAIAEGAFYPKVTDVLPPDLGFPPQGGPETATFPANGVWTAKNFNRQETNRGQPESHFSGFAIQLDQIGVDDAIQETAGAPYVGQPLAPLSMRVGCRAKTTNGGTNMDWWRPGAPVALVCPTQTPAQVYELDIPIVLGRGESITIELEVPIGPTVSVDGSPAQVRPYYNIGVSLAGYATIT